MGHHWRRTTGSRFSEGARLLWAQLESRGLSVAQASAAVERTRGLMSNVLYGERRPGVVFASDLARVFGVPIGAWAEKPTEPFVPPAAREPEPEEEPSEGAA